MRIGVPKETTDGERRVAMVPEVVAKLTRAGGEDASPPEVMVQRGAGAGALIPDEAYAEAGA
jgi:NAD(P) transhydrogenase subunit alpha